MTTLDLLRAGRAKIKTGWCQGASARDEAGQGKQAESETACRWCLTGAIEAFRGEYGTTMFAPNSPYMAGMAALSAVVVERWGQFDDLVTFNDVSGRTQAEVLWVYDQAIEELEAA